MNTYTVEVEETVINVHRISIQAETKEDAEATALGQRTEKRARVLSQASVSTEVVDLKINNTLNTIHFS